MANKIILGAVAVAVAAGVYAYVSAGDPAETSGDRVLEKQNAGVAASSAPRELKPKWQQSERSEPAMGERGVAYIDDNGNVSYRDMDGTDANAEQATEGSKVVRHIGERLDPETYVGEGAPELIAIGEPMDPEKVYPDSGAKELQTVGEKITDVENYLGEGSKELRMVGERIPSNQVQ
ncbi:hypothetical protein [Idiomarina aquatica]|nr:hypothetical protein [Idiomarina aquatica]